MSKYSNPTTSNCFPLRFRKTNARLSVMILPRLTGGSIGLTFIFRHCADGFIRSSKGARRNRARAAHSLHRTAETELVATKIRRKREQRRAQGTKPDPWPFF